MSRLHRPSGGQILVIFAGGLVAMLLIGALVVDLGMVFMQRRQEQNAADPGALAAARYIRPTAVTTAGSNERGSMWNAACFYALQNGYSATRTDTNAACPSVATPDGSTVTVNWPPSKAAVEYAGNPGYVEVVIGRPYRSLLAGIVGIATFQVSTSAVAANDDGSGGSSSLVSLSDQGCGGTAPAKINGGGSGGGIDIHTATGVSAPGGYIQVNSACGGASYGGNDACANNSQGAFEISGSNTTVIAPALFVQGACTYSGNTAPSIDTVDEQAAYVGDPLAIIKPPTPGTPATCPTGASGTAATPKTCSFKAQDGLVTLNPGTYYGGWSIGAGATIKLNPGIYIIAGGGIAQTSGTLDSAQGRVLIYGTDDPQYAAACKVSHDNLKCQQNIDLHGSGSISLRGLARDSGCPPYGASTCPYGGMLLWQDGHASGAYAGRADISIGGGTSTNLEGTIYSAGGDVSMLGSSNTTGCTLDGSGNQNCAAVQIIAWTFQIGGSAILNMPYDPNLFYHVQLKGLVR
ncbi:MAG: pilus assembly protein TadG-related protein [Chloroflexota bacterium]